MHLVASSVPELAASDVTLVDQAGSLLNSPDDNSEAAVSTRQLEYTHKLEESYKRRIVELARAPGRRRAACGPPSRRTSTSRDRGDARELRSAEDRRAQRADQQRVAQGRRRRGGHSRRLEQPAPGHLRRAGDPGRLADAGLPAPARRQTTAASSGPSSSSQKSTRNFEVDRTLAYVKQPTGTLKRLSVGVVLDDWQKVDEDGKVTAPPMSDADIKRFTQLVRESIGLKEDRGDQLNVLNQAFQGNASGGSVDGPPLWQAPWVPQVAKQAVGAGLVLLVAFLILRPLMKSLTKTQRSTRLPGTARTG